MVGIQILLTASLLQAMRSTNYAAPFVSRRSTVIGVFRSSHYSIVPASSCSLSVPLFVLCIFIVGIRASGISIPLTLLMLLGCILMWIGQFPRLTYVYTSEDLDQQT